jgi:hypothetical protein
MGLNGAEVTEVFEFWRSTLSNGRAKLDEKRRKAIRARLLDGYSVDELKLAILGCRFSEFHQGENDRRRRYCSITLICRDADRVEQFLEIADEHAARVARKTVEKAQAEEAPERRSEDTQAKIDALRRRLGVAS